MDFRDLNINKADFLSNFPLSHYDILVDKTVGHDIHGRFRFLRI